MDHGAGGSLRLLYTLLVQFVLLAPELALFLRLTLFMVLLADHSSVAGASGQCFVGKCERFQAATARLEIR